MKLRSQTEYENIEPVRKFKKIAPEKIKASSVKQHQVKIRHVNHDKRTNEINKFASKIKDVRVVLNRIALNAAEQEKENDLKFTQAYKRARERRMTEFLKPVDSLSLDGNVAENWRVFKRNYDIFMIAKGIDEKTDVVKINTFLNAIGKDAVEVYDSFNLSPVERATYTAVIKAFEDFCKPRKNVVYERYRFGSRNQQEGEPFDTFLMDIKKLARNCAYNNEDEMIRDRIVIGTADSKLRGRLLTEQNLTMDQAIEKARASELTKEQTESMNKSSAVNEISSSSNSTQAKHTNQATKYAPRAHGKQGNNKNKQRAYTQYSSQNQQQQQQRQRNTHNGGGNNNNSRTHRTSHQKSDTRENINCTRCGYQHKIRECPAFGKQCRNCSKQNHYSSMCKQRTVATIDTHTDSDSSEYYVGTLNTNIHESSSETSDSITFPWIEPIKMNGQNVSSKIDTGAETDVLPLNVLKKMGPIELRSTSVTLRAFGGTKIKPTGMCTLLLSFNGISFKKNFAVVDLDFVPIIGLKTSVRLGIVQPSRVYKNSNNKRKHL